MLSTEATKFSKKQVTQQLSGGKIWPRDTYREHRTAFYLRVLDTQKQTRSRVSLHKPKCLDELFYSSALQVLRMSMPLRGTDKWTRFRNFSRIPRNSTCNSRLVSNQAGNRGDYFSQISQFTRTQAFLHPWVSFWHIYCYTNSLHRLRALQEVLLSRGCKNWRSHQLHDCPTLHGWALA